MRLSNKIKYKKRKLKKIKLKMLIIIKFLKKKIMS